MRTILLKTVCLLLFASLCLLAVLPFSAAEPEVGALFINVGKADAALFFLGEKRFLIDTGTKGSYETLETALKRYQISRLDGVLITHTDKDHVGGLKKLLKSGIEIGALYAGTLYAPEDDEHPVTEAADKAGIQVNWLRAGDSIQMGNDCVFDVLGPLSLDAENENNNSLVLRLHTPQGDMLLTGDMELEEEAELLQNGVFSGVAVLKVAHHGEDDSTSRVFTLTVRPKLAVISTNTAEESDTPDSKIIARLWEIGAQTAVTQEAALGIYVTLTDGNAAWIRID